MSDGDTVILEAVSAAAMASASSSLKKQVLELTRNLNTIRASYFKMLKGAHIDEEFEEIRWDDKHVRKLQILEDAAMKPARVALASHVDMNECTMIASDSSETAIDVLDLRYSLDQLPSKNAGTVAKLKKIVVALKETIKSFSSQKTKNAWLAIVKELVASNNKSAFFIGFLTQVTKSKDAEKLKSIPSEARAKIIKDTLSGITKFDKSLLDAVGYAFADGDISNGVYGTDKLTQSNIDALRKLGVAAFVSRLNDNAAGIIKKMSELTAGLLVRVASINKLGLELSAAIDAAAKETGIKFGKQDTYEVFLPRLVSDSFAKKLEKRFKDNNINVSYSGSAIIVMLARLAVLGKLDAAYIRNSYDKQAMIVASALMPEVLIDMKKNVAGWKDKLVNSAEAPKGAPMGLIAFGTERLDNVPPEKNTKIEDGLLDGIRNHFVGNKKFNKNDVEMIKLFLKKKMYSKVIHEPAEEKLYRGMGVSEKWLQELLKKNKIPASGSIKKKGTYRIKKGEHSSSWSTRKSKAHEFASGVYEGYEIIMTALVADNRQLFIAGPDGLYKLSVTQNYSDEHECVGLGDIRISEISWKSISDDDY